MLSNLSTKGFKEYIKIAKKILDGNWTGSYTKPSPSLYPHQWNWDSGFIAIGYSHYNSKRAMREILSLFDHFLVDLFRRCKYSENDIYKECPFLIQDILFNSILCKANRDLFEIANILKEDSKEIEEWISATSNAISEKLMISQGLKSYGYAEKADSMKIDMIQLMLNIFSMIGT